MMRAARSLEIARDSRKQKLYCLNLPLDCEQSLFCSRIGGEERKIFEARVTRASAKAASSVGAGIFAARARDSSPEDRGRLVFFF